MRFKYETRDQKVSALLRELEQEMTNMVPYRHFYAMENCMKQVMGALETLTNASDNPEHKDMGKHALAAMSIILTGELPDVERDMVTNADYIKKFWMSVYEEELLARQQRKSDNIHNNK